MPSEALNAFYVDLLHALGEWHRRPTATARGAVVVVKHVAERYGLEQASRVPLPRLTREERAELAWEQRVDR
jgi:hypothetical protein